MHKDSYEKWFVIIALSLSLLLSFLFGYTVFRYWQIDVCKPLMKQENSNSFEVKTGDGQDDFYDN